jgi:cobalt/nickel transport system permease protein
MHIPNGFLSDPVCALSAATSSAAIATGFWQVRRGEDRASAQSLAGVAGLVFAVQMVNFPIDHGTSGHLIGAALATMLLGPWSAMLAMASVVATQAVVFADGGFGSLGANLLSMAVVAPWAAWLGHRCLARSAPAFGGGAMAWGLAAAVSVVAAAVVCSLLLAAGGAGPIATIMPAMLWAHLPVGLVEGLATAAAVLLVKESGKLPLVGRSANSGLVLLATAAALAIVLAPLASSAPDGLESVSLRLGFATAATGSYGGLLPDYVWPGVEWAPLAVALAGLCGVLIVSAASYLVGRAAAVVRKSN